MSAPSRRTVLPLIKAAWREDAVSRDITSRAVIPASARIRARVVARQRGVLAGGRVAVWTFQAMDRSVRCRLHRRDGARLAPGQPILTVRGPARAIFATERTALNFLMHLSGIATLTAEYVRRVKGTRARIYDTRKTLPGHRVLEKDAVRAGGGRNHRMDLADQILIKTNHLVAVTGHRSPVTGRVILEVVRKAKAVWPRRFVEVEVASLRAFRAALTAKPDAILLDNWTVSAIRKAVNLRNSAFRIPHSALLLEVSGGVTLANVRAIAKTGVDRISIGRLTHSAPALDMALEVAGGR